MIELIVRATFVGAMNLRNSFSSLLDRYNSLRVVVKLVETATSFESTVSEIVTVESSVNEIVTVESSVNEIVGVESAVNEIITVITAVSRTIKPTENI